jgi:glycosyltransferase involved in cell wall biosynthesis
MSGIPVVSVLMTAFNRSQYINDAIESVIAQTYQNWELIIVDDNSNDNTASIAHFYAAKDNRISVYVNELNLGDYKNRN